MMTDLAVVAPFVNVGAALLPAAFAGAVTFVSLLFKPRELVRAVRRRPAVVPVGLLAVIALCLCGMWAMAGPRSRSAADAAAAIDWSELGGRIVQDRKYAHLADRNADVDLILGRDAGRCGHDGGPPPLGLELRWSYGRPRKLPDGNWEPDTYFFASPVVRGGVVYAASTMMDIFDKRGWVVAVDADTGRQKWKAPLPKPGGPEAFRAIFSSPAVTADGKNVIVGQGLHEHSDCSLLCLDAETGETRWQVPTPLHLESSPAVRGDLVVIGAGAIEDANKKPTGDPGFVLAVRISTGKEVWRHPVPDAECSPAIGDDGVVYIGAGVNGNAVVALRCEPDEELKQKGLDRLLWRTAAPFPVTGAVTLAGDLVVVGAGNGDFINVDPRPAGVVLALDRRTGKEVWRRPMPDAVLGHVSHRDGKLVCPVRNGELYVLDAASGAVVWRKRVAGDTPILAGCAFTGSHVYAVTRDGYLHVLDARTGDPAEPPTPLNDRERPGEQGYAFSSPTIVGNRVYVGSETGGLRCLTGTK